MSDKITRTTQTVVNNSNKIGQSINEVNTTLQMLKTEVDRAGAFGFGRRILVPPDEIHVVVGDGRHIATTGRKRHVYGQTADRTSVYWLNKLTQVIKLKTISFTVPIRGHSDEGVEALDSSKVSFKMWAHAVAKLNPEKAEIAAQRVGLDTGSLINTITQVGTAELVSAAATFSLEEIIASRQELAQKASQRVNQILSEIGYDLALLTITRLDGEAYRKLVEQAEARISKEASIVTNREQVAEIEDRKAREQREAEIKAKTDKKLAAESLEAEEKVQTATLSQQETLNIQRHTFHLQEIEREKGVAQAAHEAELAKIELTQAQARATAENQAKLARLQAEREADLKKMTQERTATIRLAETEAEAERMALQQARQIERDAERTAAEARRLQAEELARAERAKQVTLVEANQLAESMEIEAEAKANALRLKIEAETKAELVKAEAEASAVEKRAQAAKIRAEASRAEAAAPGLAEAEVEVARVEIAERQVAVSRAEGLAQAEVAQAQAKAEAERLQKLKEVDINAQRELADLYNVSPVLVELEKTRMQLAHKERVATIQAETYLKAFEAIAPSMRINLYGNGGQTSQILNQVMALSHGIQHLGQEVPLVGRIINGVETNGASEPDYSALLGGLSRFMPYIQQTLSDINPRMLSSLKVSDLLERIGPLVAGEEDLASALGQLKENVNFKVVGDLPLKPLLGLLGVSLRQGGNESPAKPATPVAELVG